MKLSWQQIPSTIVTQLLCKDMDGVVLDLEHGCFDNETIYSCIQVAQADGKKCLARLTEITKTQISFLLDAGLDGLIFSTVESVEQCEKIFDNCLYPPNGKRGLGLTRQNLWGHKELIPDKRPILICQIETSKAVDRMAEISSFDFDYYLIGPYDLSMSLGCPGDFTSDKFLLKINQFNDKIPERKRAVHIPSNVEENIKTYKDYGLKCLGMDTIAILEAHREFANAEY